MTRSRPSDAAFNFEAVLVSAAKNKDGYVIRLAIHPNDVPASLVQDPVGTRYQVAAVRLGDDEEPVPPPKPKTTGQELVQKAGILCRDADFLKYVGAKDENDCAVRLHDFLEVDSRAELATNRNAQNIFMALLAAYEKTIGRPL